MSGDLDAQQIEYLRLIASGIGREKIAEQLGWTEIELEVELEKIQRALNVQTPGQAIVIALRKGLLVAYAGVAVPLALIAHHLPLKTL